MFTRSSSSRPVSRIECLESRIAPAGVVTVSFVKGVLTLTGDAGNNAFNVVGFDASHTQLVGQVGTVFRQDGLPDTGTLLLTSPIKSITMDLGDGADTFDLTGVTVAGDVTIDGGPRPNNIILNGVTIKGSLSITTGDTTDNITFSGENVSVQKNLTLNLDGGANTVQVNTAFSVGGNLTYTGGSGDDFFQTIAGSVKIGGSATFTMGAGGATIGTASGFAPVFTYSIGKKLTIDTTTSQPGNQVVVNFGALTAKIGDVEIIDGAGDLTFGGPSVLGFLTLGNVKVTTGTGNASLNFVGLQVATKAITVDAIASAGTQFALGGGSLGGGGIGTITTGAVTYTGGVGVDAISLFSGSGKGAGIGASFNADLGDGENVAQIVGFAGLYKTFKLNSGVGDDEISVVALGAKSTSIEIQTGGGEDNVMLGLLSSTVSGKVSVANSDGATLATVAVGLVNSTIGSVDISVFGDGNGVSFGSLAGPAQDFTVKKAVTVTGHGGEDTVNFGNITNAKLLGGLKIDLGNGTNLINGALTNVTSKSLTVIGGSGDDNVSLSGSGKLGAVNIDLGAGGNIAALSGGVNVLGIAALTYNSTTATGGTDTLSINRVVLTGNLNAKFGAGASSLYVDDSIIGGTFTVDTGAGDDNVNIDTSDSRLGTVLTKAASILLGDNDDQIFIGGNAISSLLTTKATFNVDGGTGTNTITNPSTNVFAKTPTLTGF